MSEILAARGLTKVYSGKAVVDNVDMSIQKGDIYGLIGPNGAGKTTLIRMICSLAAQNAGSLELFGKKTGLDRERQRLGAIIETPALYNSLSARDNLEYYRRLKGVPDKKVVEQALELVSLTDTGSKKFSKFSLGMKQRLGLALTIMNNPDFILLDEPINGLDPLGIIQMREILKNLNTERGITILISSHILSELSQVATRYGVMNRGRMVKQFSSEELTEQCRRCVCVTTPDAANAAAVLETALRIKNYKVVSPTEVRVYEFLDRSEELNRALVTGGIPVKSIYESGDNLEDYFKTLIGEAV